MRRLTSVLWQHHRRQCFSYPYWTDFAYHSSLSWRPRSLAWLGFHLLIVLSIVLVLLTRTWDSYPSVSQMHSIGDKGQGHLTQYTLQRRWRCQHRLLFTLWLLLSTWFLYSYHLRTCTSAFTKTARWRRRVDSFLLARILLWLVEQRGFEPLQNLLTSGLQPGTLPLRCLLH